MTDKTEKRFSILCDLDGRVTQVLQDEVQSLPPWIVGKMLFSIVVPRDLDKIINFFLELNNKKTAIGWEINMATQTGAETFSFFGGLFEGKIGIAAATTKNGAMLLFSDLSKINNEQANLIRTLSKEKEQLQSQSEELPISYIEELSKLNNDLVNMQRELSKKNKELDELNKLKNQFLGIAAHDLRNPLGVIMGYSEFLMEELESNLSQDHIEMIKSIINSSEFMLHLLEELLDISAIESGKLALEFQKTDLLSLVKKNAVLNGVIAARKNIVIQIASDRYIPELLIDVNKIEQVLNNLISNAVKYSQPGTTVFVSLCRNENEIIVSVRDQGPGIPEDELVKLFKPFEKTSVRSTAGERSTGLGLTIVRNLIQGHKGKIWVESKVGTGTVFYFSLPL